MRYDSAHVFSEDKLKGPKVDSLSASRIPSAGSKEWYPCCNWTLRYQHLFTWLFACTYTLHVEGLTALLTFCPFAAWWSILAVKENHGRHADWKAKPIVNLRTWRKYFSFEILFFLKIFITFRFWTVSNTVKFPHIAGAVIQEQDIISYRIQTSYSRRGMDKWIEQVKGTAI